MLGSLYYACMFDRRRSIVRNVLSLFNEKYGAGFILPLEDDKPKFVPECLLGVETDRGHIIAIKQSIVMCEGSGAWFADGLRYYISDDSDETVSFDEYVEMFYNTDNTL